MNEREDYLDKLLRGVEGESEITEDEDDFFSNFGDPVSDDDEDDFLKAFEKSKSKPKAESDSKDEDDFNLDDIDNIVSNIKNGTLDDLDEIDSLDNGKDLSIEESLRNYDDDDFGLGDVGAGYSDSGSEPENDSEADFEVNTLDGEGESDFNSEETNQELLDMLSGIGEDEKEEPLVDFGDGETFMEDDFVNNLDGETADMPASDDTGSDGLEGLMDSGDSDMEDLARQLEGLGLDDVDSSIDMDDGAKDEPAPEKDKNKKEKKAKNRKGTEGDEKKPGLFKRFGLLLFGEEDKVIDASDVENLSEEDKADLQKISDEETAKEKKKQEKAEQKEEQKEQKKKDKEEKKKEKDQKKAEKEQQKKEKAEKKKEKKKDLKVIDRSKPLPKGPVILILLVGVSLVILINLFSSQVGYMLSITQAREYYEQGDYVSAYSCFTQGKKVKAVDEELYNKARLTAYVQQPINSYRVYHKQGMYAEAMSALILGVGRFDKNANEAAATGAAIEYENMLAILEKALKEEYKLSLDQARELYAIWDKEEYTLEIYRIIDELGLSTESTEG